MDASLLQQQRAALDALATTLESVERDFATVAAEFTSSAQIASQFIHQLDNNTRLSNTPQNKSIRVMLASSSKWRRALIAQILPEGFELVAEGISPDIDEKAIRHEDARELVLAIAHAKADAVLRKLRQSTTVTENMVDLIICCDQVIVHGREIREKPGSKEECKMHLQSYGETGEPARCVNGVVVVAVRHQHARSGDALLRVQGVEEARQYFKPIPDHVAEVLIAKGEVMHCAGSFVVEDALLAPYLAAREGDLEAVQGMPKQLTKALLLEAGRGL